MLLGSGIFQVAYVYTPEVYPTVLRSVGVGACSGVARAGAMLTPYVAQVIHPVFEISSRTVLKCRNVFKNVSQTYISIVKNTCITYL